MLRFISGKKRLCLQARHLYAHEHIVHMGKDLKDTGGRRHRERKKGKKMKDRKKKKAGKKRADK